jgi:hypothetical protein
MNILAKIFGSSKNTETIVNGAVSGIDKMFYTKEEKAEAGQKMSEWFLRYLEATQPQNISRRFIAIVVVLLWALLILVGVAAYKFDATFSEFVFKVLADVVMNPFLIIMGFYFAAHVVRTAMSGKDK